MRISDLLRAARVRGFEIGYRLGYQAARQEAVNHLRLALGTVPDDDEYKLAGFPREVVGAEPTVLLPSTVENLERMGVHVDAVAA